MKEKDFDTWVDRVFQFFSLVNKATDNFDEDGAREVTVMLRTAQPQVNTNRKKSSPVGLGSLKRSIYNFMSFMFLESDDEAAIYHKLFIAPTTTPDTKRKSQQIKLFNSEIVTFVFGIDLHLLGLPDQHENLEEYIRLGGKEVTDHNMIAPAKKQLCPAIRLKKMIQDKRLKENLAPDHQEGKEIEPVSDRYFERCRARVSMLLCQNYNTFGLS